MNYIIFDLETKNPIPPLDPAKKLKNITYCEGWHDHAGMGISVLCAYSSIKKRYTFYDDGNLFEFIDLIADHDMTVGYNSLKFDIPVIDKCWGIKILLDPHYDICKTIYPNTKPSKSLDKLATWNGLGGKEGEAALAPILYQTHKYATLYNYCQKDVELTHNLLVKILRNEPLIIDDIGTKSRFVPPFLAQSLQPLIKEE